MSQSSRLALGVTFILLLLAGGVYFWRHQENVEEPDVSDMAPFVSEGMQLIEKDWISFTVPESFTTFPYQLKMDLLQPFEKVSIVWTHPANVEEEEHTLERFVPQALSAQYTIDPDLGNILPGKNSYEIRAFRKADQPLGEAFVVIFYVSFDVGDWEEIAPEKMTLLDFPELSSSEEQDFQGKLSVGGKEMRVYSLHSETEKSSYTRLKEYSLGATSFRYVAREDLGNLYHGENTYIFEAVDELGEVYTRRILSLQSDYLSLMDQVEETFGGFEKVKGGWFVSTRLPWFSLRPVYDTLFFEGNDQSIIMSRPTLRYTAESDRKTSLCDYLSGIDYLKDGYSYRGYSFETCQQYRYGVTVYDRFLSILKYQSVQVVKKVDYADIRDTASSAFVLIERGSMPEERSLEIFFDDAEETFSDDSSSDSTEEPQPRYYVMQMFLTDDVPYLEKKVAEIIVEADEERLQQVDDVRTLLSAHSADELFTEILFTGANAVDSQPSDRVR